MNQLSLSQNLKSAFGANTCPMKKIFEGNIDKLQNNDLKQNFLKIIDALDGCPLVIKNAVYAQFDDFIRKYKMCDDSVVKQKVDEIIANLKGKTVEELYNKIGNTELLLDSVNVAKNMYLPINSPRYFIGTIPYPDILKDRIEKRNQAIKSNDLKFVYDIQTNGINIFYSEPKRIFQALKYMPQKVINFNYENFLENNRFFSIKKFIERNKDEKEIGTYLWRNYFIKELEKKAKLNTEKKETINNIIYILNYFESKFKTKIFFDFELSDIFKIFTNLFLAELIQWKIAAKDKFKLPDMFDITKYIFGFITEFEGGLCHDWQNAIYINANKQTASLRHELIHSVDTKINDKSIDDEKVSEKFIQELREGNLPHEDIESALENWAEYKAFAVGDCNTNNYSKEHKKMLIEKGLPEYVFELPSLADTYMYYLDNFYIEENLRKTLAKIKKIYSGTIPGDIGEILVYSPYYVNLSSYIFRNNEKFSPKDFNDELLKASKLDKLAKYTTSYIKEHFKNDKDNANLINEVEEFREFFKHNNR